MVVIQFVGDIKSKYNPLRSKQPCTYRCNQSWLSHPVETNRYKGETQTSASAAKWKWSTVSTGISTNFRIYTSKTNMALENRYLEKEVPVGNQQFRIHVGFPGMDAYCSWCSVLNHKFKLLEHIMDFQVKFYKGSRYIHYAIHFWLQRTFRSLKCWNLVTTTPCTIIQQISFLSASASAWMMTWFTLAAGIST